MDMLEKAFDILEGESERRGGSVPYSRLLTLTEKFGLGVTELADLRRRVLTAGIALDDDPTTEDDSPNSSNASETDAAAEERPPEDEASIRNLVGAYLREIREVALLSKDEEKVLMQRIRAGERAAEHLALGLPDADGTVENLRDDGENARESFVEANLRLVVAMAKAFRSHGQLTLEDLIQEGNLGLLRAVETYDHTRDLKFSTYASWWIWRSIQRAIDDRGSLVRLPVHVSDRIQKLKRVERALRAEHPGRVPTSRELAEHLDLSPEAVEFLRHWSSESVSLNDQNDEGESARRLHFLLRSEELLPDTALELRQRGEVINELVAELDARTQFVVRLRFGLGGVEEHTLEEVGDQLGLTRERARQIQESGLESLRSPKRLRRAADAAGKENLTQVPKKKKGKGVPGLVHKKRKTPLILKPASQKGQPKE